MCSLSFSAFRICFVSFIVSRFDSTAGNFIRLRAGGKLFKGDGWGELMTVLGFHEGMLGHAAIQ
jgi:hypothetical protein